MKTIPNIAITHNGKFHADDVFSAALLKILNPDITIYRASQIPQDFDGLAFDLGNGEFDHHSEKKEYRENGIPYAAFGLLWREFGTRLVSPEAAIQFDQTFIQPLDRQDNLGGDNLLCRAITQANPNWTQPQNSDARFQQAVAFAIFILNNEIANMHCLEQSTAVVEEALAAQENGIVTLPFYVPWRSVLTSQDVQFVIYPSARGGYNAQGIPHIKDNQKFALYFPITWRGQTTHLPEISGIEGLTFCHSSGHLLSGDTLKSLRRACLYTANLSINSLKSSQNRAIL